MQWKNQFVYTDDERMAGLLIENGANLNLAAEDGNTPLHLATKSGNF